MLLKDPAQRPPMSIVAVVLRELSNVSTDVMSIQQLADSAGVETKLMSRSLMPAGIDAKATSALDPGQPPLSLPDHPSALPIPKQLPKPGPVALRRSIDPLEDTAPDRDGPLRTPILLAALPAAQPSASRPKPERAGVAKAQPEPPTSGSGDRGSPNPARSPAGERIAEPLNSIRQLSQSDWQPVQVVAASKVTLDKLDGDSLNSEAPLGEQRRRSLRKRFRRLRFQIKKRVYGWLGISLADQRNTPSETASTGRRFLVLASTLALVIGTFTVFLLTRRPLDPTTPQSAQPSTIPQASPPRPPPPSAQADEPAPPLPAPLLELPSELAETLKAAHKEAEAGNPKAALKLLRNSAKKYNHPVGWSAMGQYACRAGNLKQANDALDHLGNSDAASVTARGELLLACQQEGMSLDDGGHFKPSP
jgi:hypothetical protein